MRQAAGIVCRPSPSDAEKVGQARASPLQLLPCRVELLRSARDQQARVCEAGPPKMRAERNRTRPSFGSSSGAPSRRLRSGVVRQLAGFPGWLIAAAAFGDSAIRAYAEPDRPKNGSARVRKCELPDKAVVRFGFYLETESCGTVEICPGHAIDRGTLERAHRSIQSHPGKFFDVIAWVVRIADAASCLTAPACRAARASACDATCRIMHPS